MKSTEIMVKEHDNIMEFSEVVRSVCIGIMNGKEVPIEDFRTIIDFVRNYADKHHHGKEEEFLFNEMKTKLGDIGAKLITNGMLVEHDLGRLYIRELEEALNNYSKIKNDNDKLDIISNAIGYTKLIARHIDKENNVIYVYGENNLPKEVLEAVERKSLEFEQKAEEEGIQKKYLDILETLKKKYL